MRENGLLAPHRVPKRPEQTARRHQHHRGRGRPVGTDMTQTVTLAEGVTNDASSLSITATANASASTPTRAPTAQALEPQSGRACAGSSAPSARTWPRDRSSATIMARTTAPGPPRRDHRGAAPGAARVRRLVQHPLAGRPPWPPDTRSDQGRPTTAHGSGRMNKAAGCLIFQTQYNSLRRPCFVLGTKIVERVFSERDGQAFFDQPAVDILVTRSAGERFAARKGTSIVTNASSPFATPPARASGLLTAPVGLPLTVQSWLLTGASTPNKRTRPVGLDRVTVDDPGTADDVGADRKDCGKGEARPTAADHLPTLFRLLIERSAS